MTDVSVAIDAGNYLGETPIWSVDDQALWWVNCEEPPEIHRWSPASGDHRKWEFPKRVGGFVHKEGGGLLVALADGLYDFDPESGALDLRVPSPLPEHVKLHECHCDRQGRFWIGAFDHDYPANREAHGGAYFRLDGDRLTPVIEDVSVANGLAFSPDGRTMYCAEARTSSIHAYDLDPATGALSNQRVFLQLKDGEGFADGATVDSEGGYWLANVGIGRLRRYLPDGTLDRIVELPFTNPTKPAFGGPDLATLYVTSTSAPFVPTFKEPSAPNGPVYQLQPGEHGVPEVPLRG